MKTNNRRAPSLKNLFEDGKILILACDQGMEHAPSDFNEKTIDPEYIFDVGLEGRFNAIAVHSGLAEKYYLTHFKDVPLVVKLNGKTRYDNADPVSRQYASVEYAIKLGAKAVGYTLYLGSSRSHDMFAEFGKIVEEAHANGLPVILWLYARGPGISSEDEVTTDTLAYGARVALELGADVVKLKFNQDDIEGLKWIVKAAGRTKVVLAGGPKQSDYEFLKYAEKAMKAGVAGFAVGRNVFQHKKPKEFTKALREVVFEGKTAEEAHKKMKH